tara:strand:+ start:189 stop:425 length:237 start_codon:yes stop_codon:yes gene_type:complete
MNKEKFECGDCGCFFWVKSRDGFKCPNCEERLMGFRIEVIGNSGNCSINKEEEEFIVNEITKLLQNRSIDDFDIKMEC